MTYCYRKTRSLYRDFNWFKNRWQCFQWLEKKQWRNKQVTFWLGVCLCACVCSCTLVCVRVLKHYRYWEWWTKQKRVKLTPGKKWFVQQCRQMKSDFSEIWRVFLDCPGKFKVCQITKKKILLLRWGWEEIVFDALSVLYV